MNTLKYVQSDKYAIIRHQSLLGNIKRVLALAEIRCLSPSELLSRVTTIWEDPNSEEIIWCLSEIKLSNNELEALFNQIKLLSDVGDKLSSREKAHVDRIVRRLGKLLPGNLSAKLAISFLSSKRKARREAGYALLSKIELNKKLGKLLLNYFCENWDQQLLQIIAKNEEIVLELDAKFLLQYLEEHYWRVRVLQALVRHDVGRAIDLATSYPHEFVHAVGRCKAVALAGVLHDLGDKFQDDLEFVSLYIWALGKIGDRHELGRMRATIEQKPSKWEKS